MSELTTKNQNTPIDLIKDQIDLIEKSIFVQPVYETGNWCFIIHILPSQEDVSFAKNSEYENKDLWLKSEVLNTDWYLQEYESFTQALSEGIKSARQYDKQLK
ncbi:hypothetical protein [Roseivirga spongicola]|uniref:hypothetical protein n=1 Tax=Roseivirga spongicola TaxID=333140 RepID=UPI002AC8ECBF|nr:hypothetical protein [Roseivirga spongicola]WPZ08797.1 hypothetical protein T7867_11060 [Roseivirga spongicola]